MSENLASGAFFVGTLVATTHLLIGLWTGLVVGNRQGTNRSALAWNELDRASQSTQQHLSMLEKLRRRAQDGAASVASHSSGLPAEILNLLKEFVLETQSLCDQVQATSTSLDKAARRHPRKRPQKSTPTNETAPTSTLETSLSRQELEVLADDATAVPQRVDAPEAPKRYSYAMRNSLAGVYGDSMPRLGDFEFVQCHEISPLGLTYFCEEAPDYGQAVVRLGTEPESIYMLLDIVDHRLSYAHENTWYRVNARFARKLTEEEADVCRSLRDEPAFIVVG